MRDFIEHFFQNFAGFINYSALAENLWLIIAFPLIGALLSGMFGKWLGKGNVGFIACGTVASSFVMSFLCYIALNDRATVYAPPVLSDTIPYAMGRDYGVWFSAGRFVSHYGLFVDHLSGVLMLVITGIGLLIHIYSTSYMEHDEGFTKYFSYLNLFIAMMLTLVMADNLVLTFVGWEGVGLCSYLLIGFWYTDAAKAWAGRKAFIANRVGDFAFVIGMMLLTLLVWSYEGSQDQSARNNFPSPGAFTLFNRAVDPTVSLGQNAAGALSYANLEQFATTIKVEGSAEFISLGTEIAHGPLQGLTFGTVLTAVLLLFLLGAAGKSAQFPLYVWLPDAMAGPTPVSALIHAATMVTAGVYLFCRLSFLLVLSPTAMAWVACIGAVTALLAAVIAFAQDDIKKVLAYSTVSQLGFMFMGVGMGVFWAAALHLVTHAAFKACLFLGAGSVMHGNADETDIKKLGGLRHEMKATWLTFAVATLAITGFVPLSGFFSKDAILHGVSETVLAGHENVRWFVLTVGFLAALGTAFYMTRLYLLTFEGRRSPQAKIPHAHESDGRMTVPLMILAFLAVVLLVHGVPGSQGWFSPGARAGESVMENFLSPAFHPAHQILESARIAHTELVSEAPVFSPMVGFLIAWVLAAIGTLGAVFFYMVYVPKHAEEPLPAFMRSVRKVVQDKFYVDEIYDFLIVNPIKFLSKGFYNVVDKFFIDTVAVRGTARLTEVTGRVLRYIQTGDAQWYAALMAMGLVFGAVYALGMVWK